MEFIDFPYQFDEMPLAGKFLFDSFTEDQEEFERLYPVFDETFKTRFHNQIKRARELVCHSPEGQKIQIIRERVHRKIDSLNVFIIEIKDAVPVEQGKLLSILEKAVRGKDLEQVIHSSKELLKKLEPSVSEKRDGKISEEVLEEIKSLLEILELDRLELNRLLKSRGLLTEDIFRSLNHLWATMQDVLEIGREIHEGKSPERLTEYQVEQIRYRIKSYRATVKESHETFM